MNNKLMETNEKYSKVLHEMARIDAGVMKTSEVLGLLKKVREEFKINKPKMAYSRDLPKMA